MTKNFWGLYVLGVGYTAVILFLCYILPFSQLFRFLHNYDSLFHTVEESTAAHAAESRKYFKSLDSEASSQIYRQRMSATRDIKFAIGIVTVKRKTEQDSAKKKQKHDKTGYLLHTMAVLDEVLKKSDYLQHAVPFICNVDLKPTEHSDATQLYSYFPYAERYGANSMNMPILALPNSTTTFKQWTIHGSKLKKETVDYTFCLMTAAFLKPQYVILLEDDTVPHKDFSALLEHFLESRLYNYPHYAYLKLYYPPKWQGYGFSLSRIIDLILSGLIMTSFLYLILIFYYKCQLPFNHELVVIDLSDIFFPNLLKLRFPYSGRAFSTLFWISLLSCWLIGRQNIETIRRLCRYFFRLLPAERCCTQAQLYPSYIIPSISRYLIGVEGTRHTDLAISDFVAEYNYDAWQVEPNLFFHCGLHTSLTSQQKHPEEFAFNL